MLNHYDLAEIQSLRLDWVRFMNAGNVARLGSLAVYCEEYEILRW